MTPGKSDVLNQNLSFVAGDEFGGIPSIIITVGDVPPADDLASASIQFRSQPTNPIVRAELSTTAGTITITSAANWELSIPAQTLELKPGTYYWSLRTVDISGDVQTYLEGTIEVLQPVTRP